MKTTTSLVMFIGALLVLFWIFYQTTDHVGSNVSGFGFLYKGTQVSASHATITAGFVLAGILLGLSGEFLRQRQKRSLATFALSEKTVLSLIAAPFVVVYAFDQIYTHAYDLSGYFAAFQTGYFFRSVMTLAQRPTAGEVR